MVLQCNHPCDPQQNSTSEKQFDYGSPSLADFEFEAKLKPVKRKFSAEGSDCSRDKTSMNENVSPTRHRKVRSSKRNNEDITLEWLEENYMMCEGASLARCALYNHYLDFCEKHNFASSCAATFGKTIRKKFGPVATRRLGTRGHSMYHYHGIGIRETSIYYNTANTVKGLTRFSPALKTAEKISRIGTSSYASEAKYSIERFLDEVPNVSQFTSEFGNGISWEEVQSFIVLYKSFCERVLSAALNRNFEAISSCVLNCWNNLPCQTYRVILHDVVVVDIIILCDTLLHEALIDALLPTPCENLDERHLLGVCNLGKQWENWCKSSMISFPVVLVGKKLSVAQQFSQLITRQISIIHLSRSVRVIFENPATFHPLLADIEKIDFPQIGSHAFYTNAENEDREQNTNKEMLKNLKDLLQKQASIGMIVEYLDTTVDAKVIKPIKQSGRRSFKKRAQDFILKWSFFIARITHSLAINEASSFNSFHFLRMMMDEYVLFAIETQFYNEKRQEARNLVIKHAKNIQSTVGKTRVQNDSSIMDDSTFTPRLIENNITAKFNTATSPQTVNDYGSWCASNLFERVNYQRNELELDFHFQNRVSNNVSNHDQVTSVQNFHIQAPFVMNTFGKTGENNLKHDRKAHVDENDFTFTHLTNPTSSYTQNPSCLYQTEIKENPLLADYYRAPKLSREAQNPNFEPANSSTYKSHFTTMTTIPQTKLAKLRSIMCSQELAHLQQVPSVSPPNILSPLSDVQQCSSPLKKNQSYTKDIQYLNQDSISIWQESRNEVTSIPNNNGFAGDSKNSYICYGDFSLSQENGSIPEYSSASTPVFPVSHYEELSSFSSATSSTAFSTSHNAIQDHHRWNLTEAADMQQLWEKERTNLISDEILPSISSVLNAD